MYITNNFLRLTGTLILGLQLLTLGMASTGLSSDILWSQSHLERAQSGWSIELKQNGDFEPPDDGGPSKTRGTGTRCCGSRKPSIPN